MKYFLLTLFLMTNLLAQECPTGRPDYFCKSVTQNESKELNANEFYLIPSKIFSLYENEISHLSYPFIFDGKWQSPYFGAGVSLFDNSFHLMILGGTTRISMMTKDAYAAIVCHELGHLLGGEPRQTISGADFASAEGQADFYAASTCLPRYFSAIGISKNDLNNRIEKAGYEFLSLATLFDSEIQNTTLIRSKVQLPVVNETIINRYPSFQCRYENYRNPIKRPSCWFYN
jgi:hypothetical protein